jgi:hypothetical protein
MPSIEGYSDLGSSTHLLKITLLACSGLVEQQLPRGASMDTSDRRNFLKLIGSSAIAAALPLDLSKVLAIQANNRTGTIADVEHIVILMQDSFSDPLMGGLV